MSRPRALALPLPLAFLFRVVAGWIHRAQEEAIEYLRAENAVLRELPGGAPRLTDAQRRRLAEKAQPLGRSRLAELAAIATPDTILRWFHKLVARKYDASRQRGHGGHPRTKESAVDAVLRIARECPTYGYTRLRDAVSEHHDLSRATVVRILKEHGIEPAPERGRKTTWRTFLRAHWEVLAAADFFTSEVLTWTGIVRYHVLVFMELATRRVHVAAIVHAPGDDFMRNVARNVTDAFDGFLRGKRYLILDRDPLFSRAFRAILEGAGIEIVRLPPRSPNLNPHAERWIRSIREECLSRLVLLGERSLRVAVEQFVVHYHRERHHQGLGGRLIDPEPGLRENQGPIACRERLGGLLKFHHRSAA